MLYAIFGRWGGGNEKHSEIEAANPIAACLQFATQRQDVGFVFQFGDRAVLAWRRGRECSMGHRLANGVVAIPASELPTEMPEVEKANRCWPDDYPADPITLPTLYTRCEIVGAYHDGYGIGHYPLETVACATEPIPDTDYSKPFEYAGGGVVLYPSKRLQTLARKGFVPYVDDKHSTMRHSITHQIVREETFRAEEHAYMNAYDRLL